MDNKDKDLYYLNELSDYKVDSDYPDVRGWEVKDKDNRVVGKVDNLLVSKKNERVVYLDIDVDDSIIEANYEPYSRSADDGVHGFVNEDGDNHLILPIGMTRLDDNNNDVYTDEIDHRTFAETRRKKRNLPVEREYEIVVLDSYGRDRDHVDYTDDDDFYERDEFKYQRQ